MLRARLQTVLLYNALAVGARLEGADRGRTAEQRPTTHPQCGADVPDEAFHLQDGEKY